MTTKHSEPMTPDMEQAKAELEKLLETLKAETSKRDTPEKRQALRKHTMSREGWDEAAGNRLLFRYAYGLYGQLILRGVIDPPMVDVRSDEAEEALGDINSIITDLYLSLQALEIGEGEFADGD